MKLGTILNQLMLSFLFTHELDAMTQSEWRLLYVLRNLGDDNGRWWFVVIHIPLFYVLIALTNHTQERVQNYSRVALAAFCIVHALLHLNLRNDPLSTFNSVLSWGVILGAALFGLIYLVLVTKNRNRKVALARL